MLRIVCFPISATTFNLHSSNKIVITSAFKNHRNQENMANSNTDFLPIPSHYYNACSRCQSVLQEITHFFTEVARCSAAQPSREELEQRADVLVESMMDAIHELEMAIPMEQRDLWLREQIDKYNAVVQELFDFLWDEQVAIPV